MGEKYVSRAEIAAHEVLIPLLQDQPRQEISITLPDGSQRKGTSWETSPMDVAKQISQSLADRVVIAKVCPARILQSHSC